MRKLPRFVCLVRLENNDEQRQSFIHLMKIEWTEGKLDV